MTNPPSSEKPTLKLRTSDKMPGVADAADDTPDKPAFPNIADVEEPSEPAIIDDAPLSEQDYVRARRSAARLAAIQSLYEQALLKLDTASLAESAADNTLKTSAEALKAGDSDRDFGVKPNSKLLRTILQGVAAEQDALDTLIKEKLTGNWRFERLGALLTSILRAGAFEIRQKNTPAPHLLAEYVELTEEFFDDPELGMVNAVLEAIAKIEPS